MSGLDDSLVGRHVVRCPGCGEERWYGYGACGRCGAYLEGAVSDANATDESRPLRPVDSAMRADDIRPDTPQERSTP